MILPMILPSTLLAPPPIVRNRFSVFCNAFPVIRPADFVARQVARQVSRSVAASMEIVAFGMRLVL